MTILLAAQLRALKDERISFDAFARNTKEDFRRMAGKLFRRWRLPVGVSEEDVQQEMLLNAWIAVMNFDPGHGVTLTGYVVWCAHTGTKKWLHTQRKALRRSGSAPGRFPVCLSGMRLDVDEEMSIDGLLDLLAHTEPEQERVLEEREEREQCAAQFEDPAMRAWVLSGGDAVEAGSAVYADWRFRLMHELGCEEDAEKHVRRAVRREILERSEGG